MVHRPLALPLALPSKENTGPIYKIAQIIYSRLPPVFLIYYTPMTEESTRVLQKLSWVILSYLSEDHRSLTTCCPARDLKMMAHRRTWIHTHEYNCASHLPFTHLHRLLQSFSPALGAQSSPALQVKHTTHRTGQWTLLCFNPHPKHFCCRDLRDSHYISTVSVPKSWLKSRNRIISFRFLSLDLIEFAPTGHKHTC